MFDFNDYEIDIGIMPNINWSLSHINLVTEEKCKYTIETLYNYEKYNEACKRRFIQQYSVTSVEDVELDNYMWTTITEYLEGNRKFVYDSYIEQGVNECESYFISLKFLQSSLKKFRNMLYREFNNRDDYDRSTLKIALNHLIHVKLDSIMVSPKYKFSKESASDQLGCFRTDAANATAEYLAQETGAIFHAKITL